MYCPKCAAQNVDDARFCRVCGADISLVSQALVGRLVDPAAIEDAQDLRHRRRSRRDRDRDRPATLDRAVTQVFSGLGFIFLAFAVFLFLPSGRYWWFWMLFPAISGIGRGVGEYIRYQKSQQELPNRTAPQPMFAPAPPINILPQRNTGELNPQPLSVTEGTTKLLNDEMPTRALDRSKDQNL